MEEKNSTQAQPQVTPPPVNNSVFSTPPTTKGKKRFVVLLAALVVLIAVSGTTIFFFLNQGKNTKQVVTKPTPTQTKASYPAPKLTAKEYSYTGSLPAASNLKVYKLKTDFNKDYVADFSSKLQLTTLSSEEEGVIYATNKESENYGILAFNTSNGTFTYQSFGNLTLGDTKTTAPSQKTVTILSELGLMDDTISCDITYKDTSTPGVTYVECHREWTKLNAPLVNLGGVLNLPENVMISSLAPGKVSARDNPPNKQITNVSNGGNGLARPNDFNTITVGLFEDGSIYTINSTMRQLESTETVNDSDTISPTEALDLIKQNKGMLTVSVPAGVGTPSWENVFPGNLAQADIANITEIIPAYVDEPLTSSQKEYAPYFLVRGTAKISSGYTIEFTQVVPLQKEELLSLSQTIAEDNSIQLKTFTLPTATPTVPTVGGRTTPTPTTPTNTGLTPTPTTPSTTTVTPTPTTNLPTTPPLTVTPTIPNFPATCHLMSPDHSAPSFTLKIPGYGNLEVLADLRQGENSAHTYFFVSDESLSYSPAFNAIRDAFFKGVEEQYAILSARSLLKGNFTPPPYKPGDKGSAFNYDGELVLPPLIPSDAVGGSSLPFCNGDLFGGSGTCWDRPRVDQIRDAVTARMNLVKNNTQALNALASSEDIFPGKTLWAFNWVFLHSFGHANPGVALPSDYVTKPGEKVQCYISGSSPAIFVYSDARRDITIQTFAKQLTYSDPAAQNNTWEGFVDKNLLFVNGIQRDLIYYEYESNSVTFTEQKEGFITNSVELDSLIENISKQLELTHKEEEALKADAKNASRSITASRFKVSIIDEEEIEKNLPLTISPKPQKMTRFYLMISDAPSVSLKAPHIQKIVRSPYSALELGVFRSK